MADCYIHAASMRLNKTSISLHVGGKQKLKIKGTSKKIKWSSSKKSVATVSQKGSVTARKKGYTTVTAKIGKTKLKCKVTVKKKASSNSGNTVWITDTGNKYHRRSSCSNMKHPYKVSLKKLKTWDIHLVRNVIDKMKRT